MHHHDHTHNHTHTHDHAHDGTDTHHEHRADVHADDCHCGCGADHSDHFEEHKKTERIKLIAAAVFFAAGWVCSELLSLPDIAALICYLICYVISGWAVLREALEDMVHGRLFGECFLISVASVGALIIGDYSEGCAVMLLFGIGEYIQGAALSRSRSAIRKLSDEHGFQYAHANSGTERFISQFAKVYTPIICALAVAIALLPPLLLGREWKEWIYRGLSALVIGCPCAIVISVPLAFSCAIGACTKQGIFVHCSDALESLYKNRAVSDSESEIVIPDGSEEKRAYALLAARKAVTIARENVCFALAAKLVILVLAVFMTKEVPIWLAEFGDVGVAVLAILNALRAMRVK